MDIGEVMVEKVHSLREEDFATRARDLFSTDFETSI